ncbi:MAG: thioesterase, partial [Xanthomonadales bacterium]|nr:thioesterase [Xanthomonadales bacterium]
MTSKDIGATQAKAKQAPRKAAAKKSAKSRLRATPLPAADAALQLPPLFVANIDVRWRDLDAFNHVNNSNFLTYLEEARLQ